MTPQKSETTERFKVLAKRYDLGNSLLTLGLHRTWKRTLIKKVHPQTKSLLDGASGTGDLALMALARCPAAKVMATDISIEMLGEARVKLAAQDDRLTIQEGDLQNLPFAEDEFEVATVAFGLRNVACLESALHELGRVTAKQILILETGAPISHLAKSMFSFQQKWAATVGTLLGQKKHYEYLATSTAAFPSAGAFMEKLSHAFPHAFISCIPMKPFPVFLYEVRFD